MSRFGNVVLVIFLAMYHLVNAQALKFEQFTTKDGLLSDEVYNLHQDKKGYIWLFTHYGPMKYNGTEFVPVLRNLPFKESVIYAIYENQEGRKWIANSNKNIYEVRNDSAFIVKGTQNCSEVLRNATNEIVQIFVDDSLNIYAKTTLRTSKFSKDGNGEYHLQSMNELLTKRDDCSEHVLALGNELMAVSYLTPVSTDHLLLNKHIRFHNGSGVLGKPDVIVPAKGRARFSKRFGNATYFNFPDDVIKITSDGKWKKIIPEEHVLNFTMDSRGHLWLACYREGLIEVDENDSIVHQYFKGKTVNDVLTDSHNGLWISTDGAGIYHCKNINELYYNEDEPFGKPVNFIKKIREKLFIGTTDFNLSYIENGKTHAVDKAYHVLRDDPQDMYYYKSFYLVNYRMHYELLFPQASGKFSIRQAPDESSHHNPLLFVAYAHDALLFLGRNRIGILRNAEQLRNSKSINIKNIRINCKSFCAAQSGNDVLIGTDKGVFCFENDTLSRPAYLKSTEKYVVTRIVKDNAGNIWFCTQGNGLLRVNNRKELLNYTTANGLSSNIVNDVFFMGDGSFLLSNNKGLYHCTGFSSMALSGGRKLLDGEVQSALVFKGRIYVGTKNGLVVIDERSLQPRAPSYLNLRAVYVNDEQTNEQQIGALSYRRNNLRFTFDVISFSEEKHVLEYVLYNTTVDSGIVNEDEVNLKRLAPGSYTLAVRLKDETGQQVRLNNEAGQEILLPFTIVPAFWQTAWFLVLMIFSALVLIVVAGRTLFKYYRTRALRKSEAEKLIAEYRLIALKAQINPHFMSNCIAAIQHLILQGKVNEANEYLAKFSFLVRQVLNLSNKSLVPLKEEVEMIELYIKLEKLRFDKINVEFYVDPAIDTSFTFIPPLLSQPIIENAIWHGLLALGPDKTPLLSLSIKQEAQTLLIIIEDNGVGRTMSGRSIGNSSESKGIAITRQRIENLKFISRQDLASISYEDLLDANGHPAGTRVTISLPDNLHL